MNGKAFDNPVVSRFTVYYLRWALRAAFLSGIASRFGLYGPNVGYGSFANFIKATADVNAFMPAFTIPFLAWTATVAELLLGLALIVGLWPRWVAFASAILLLLFGTAMAISHGIKDPLDYSVFSASAGALLLALYQPKPEINHEIQIHQTTNRLPVTPSKS